MQLAESGQDVLFLESCGHLIDSYDYFIIDLWGVLHNGVKPFKGALLFLKKLKDHHKTVWLLSNAPRRVNIARQRLKEIGFNDTLYDNILTSGEECYKALKTRPDDFHRNLGKKLYHLGPERDRTLFQGLDYYEVGTEIERAEFVLNTGTLRWEDTMADYKPLLKKSLEKNLPMVCSNPDKVVRYHNQLALCAGSISEEYEKLGGSVRYHGKPFLPIYEKVFAQLRKPEKSRILAIGDSLATDILGANRAGIDSLLILGGIYDSYFKKPEKQKMIQLIEQFKSTPTYITTVLQP